MTHADLISRCVLDTFKRVPKKGKPIRRSNGVVEWTVLAGIVAIRTVTDSDTEQQQALDCLSLATGVKATPNEQLSEAKGTLLHDMHAEILAIRGLNLFLVNECKLLKETGFSEYLELNTSSGNDKTSCICPYRIKKSVNFAMYVSELPCGDASMSLVHEESKSDVPWSTPIDLAGSGGTVRGRSHFNVVGVVRTKPGRKDSRVTYSKSCSDKLALRQFTSLLLGPTQKLITPLGAYLSLLVVPESQIRVPDLIRAFAPCGRLQLVSDVPVVGPYRPTFFQYEATKEVYEFRKQAESKPCPNAILHVKDVADEVILNGMKMGFKAHSTKGQSLVCRRKLSQFVLELLESSNHDDDDDDDANDRNVTYLEWKSSAQLKELKTTIHRGLATWISTDPDDFVLGQ